jgi:hypothetical protein
MTRVLRLSEKCLLLNHLLSQKLLRAPDANFALNAEGFSKKMINFVEGVQILESELNLCQ